MSFCVTISCFSSPSEPVHSGRVLDELREVVLGVRAPVALDELSDGGHVVHLAHRDVLLEIMRVARLVVHHEEVEHRKEPLVLERHVVISLHRAL